jgi:tRNA(Phe) wybutosine-synthesizing methylase Tyw3
MSVVCILTPVVIAAWPAFSAAAVAAAASLGYTVVEEGKLQDAIELSTEKRIHVEIGQSESVTDTLGRDRKLTVTRDGVSITFSRDARGKASLCVTGSGQSEAELRQLGEALAQRVVQHYVHQRIMKEMSDRGFLVVEEETTQDQSIRIKVRHWEN